MPTPLATRLRRAFALPHAGSRYAALEGYRAVAAMMVVVYHIAGTRALTYNTDLVPGRLLSALGNFGVCIFLLLSGFLLFQPFVRAHFRDTPNRSLKLYFRHRFLRILPAYWAALTISLIVIPVGIKGGPTPEFDLATYAKLYLLLSSFTKGLNYSGLAVAWTLHLEVVFYITLPFLAWIARRVFGRNALGLRKKVHANLALIAILFLIAFAFRIYYRADKAAIQGLWFPNYLDWFGLGMLLAVIACWQDMGGTLPRWVRSLASSMGFCWLIGGGVFVVYAAAIMPGIPGKETMAELFARYELAALGAFVMLIPATLGNNPHDRVRQVLQSRPFAFLGMISYGLYLWHAPVIFWTIHTNWWSNLKVKPYEGFWTEALVVVPPALILAVLSYVLIEKPIMRFKNPKPRRAHTVVSSGSPTFNDRRGPTAHDRDAVRAGTA